MFPTTVEEWEFYIRDLDEERLFIEARAANTLDFVDTLREEGYSSIEVEDILTAFAVRLQEMGFPLPDRGGGSYVSYYALVNPYPDGEG